MICFFKLFVMLSGVKFLLFAFAKRSDNGLPIAGRFGFPVDDGSQSALDFARADGGGCLGKPLVFQYFA